MLPEQDASSVIMQYVFKGGEVALKLSGAAAKNLALLLLAFLQQKNRTGGQVWVKTMVAEGTPLMSFPLPKDKLDEFTALASARGVKFAPIKSKKQYNYAASIDILARQQDTALIKDIFEKLNLGIVPIAATAVPSPITPEELVTLEQQGCKTAVDPELKELLEANGIERPTISGRKESPSARGLQDTHKQPERESVRAKLREYSNKPSLPQAQPTRGKKAPMQLPVPTRAAKTK
jgi:hypothetical protein